MKPELEQYRMEPAPFWNSCLMMGMTGYDVMEFAQRIRKWYPVASWGRDGYDLGSWPLVIVFVRNTPDSYEVIEYVEGDVCMYACPTSEIRQSIIDELAFFHWKHQGES